MSLCGLGVGKAVIGPVVVGWMGGDWVGWVGGDGRRKWQPPDTRPQEAIACWWCGVGAVLWCEHAQAA